MDKIMEIRDEIARIRQDAENAYRPHDDNNYLLGRVEACEELLEFVDDIIAETDND